MQHDVLLYEFYNSECNLTLSFLAVDTNKSVLRLFKSMMGDILNHQYGPNQT